MKKEGNLKRKLTSDHNELMYNFLLVLRALITNRFCHICNSEGRDLAGGGGGGGGGKGTRNLTSRIWRRWKCSHGVLKVSGEW